MIDEILRPRLSDDEEVAADVGREVHFRIGRVEIDDRNAGRSRFLDDVDEAARVGAGRDDGVGFGRDGGADRFLLRGDIAIVERRLDRLARVLLPHIRASEEIGPDRVGWGPVRDPVQSLGLNR